MIYLTVAILFLSAAKKLYIAQEMNLSIKDFFSKGEENPPTMLSFAAQKLLTVSYYF